MLPILARTAGGALMRQGGRAAASKLLGRKKKMQPGKAKPGGQEVDGEKSGAIVARPQTAMVSIPPSMEEPKDVPVSTTSSDSDYIESINVKVIEIKNLLKGTLAAEKKEQDDREKAEKRANRKKQEAKLEKKENKTGKLMAKMPKMPRTGFFDSLFGFITNIVLGFFAVRLIQYLPQILGFLKFLAPIGEFLIDVGIGFIDGFATFIDTAYKAYDWTRGALQTIGGDGLVAAFDGVMKAVDIAFTALTIGLLANQMTGGGLFGKGKTPTTSTPKPQPGTQGRPKVTTTGGRGINRPDIRNPLRERPKVTTTGGGTTGRPDIRNPLRQKPKVTGSGGGSKLPFKMPSAKALKVGGGIFSALMAGFEFAGRKASGQTTGQAAVGTAAGVAGGLAGAAKGAAVGAIFGPIGALIGGVIGGVGGSMLGGAVADQVTGVNKMNEGGEVKPARSVSIPPQQQDDKDRKKPSYKRIKVPEGGKISTGEKTERAWWDFLGWAGTEGKEKTIQLGSGGQILAKRVVDVGNAFGEEEYFGPILSIASKFILGQKPDEQEYRNVGYGINLLIGDGVDENAIRSGYSEGGVVQAAMSGVDISDWVSKTFKKELAQAINKNYDMSEAAVVSGSKKQPGPSGSGTTPPTGTTPGGTTPPSSSSAGSAIFGSPEMKALLDVLAYAEGTLTNRNGATGPEGYSTWAGYQMHGPTDLTGLTIQEVHDLQTSFMKEGKTAMTGSAVVGRYQFKDLLAHYAPQAGLSGSDLFSPENQDAMAIAEIKRAGITTQMLKDNGITQGYLDILAPIWASMPYSPNGGGSYYGGQPSKPAGELKDFYKQRLGVQSSQQVGPNTPQTPNLQPSQPQSSQPQSSQPPSSNVPSTISSGTGGTFEKSAKGTKLAGDLGRYIYKTLTPQAKAADGVGDFSYASEHPDFGGVRKRSYESWHNYDRAIDIGGFWPQDQKKILAKLLEFNQMTGATPVELLYGKPGTPKAGIHADHVHVAYEKGGMTLDGPHLAMIGEKGKEIVIDNDSSVAEVTPMLLAINAAKGKQEVLDAIHDYAPYDMRGEQTVVVPQPAPVPVPVPQYGSSSMMNFSSAGLSENFSEFLDYQG